MISIPAMKNTEKKVTTTIIEYDGLRIEARYSFSSNSTTSVYVNGELRETIEKPKERKTITAKGSENEHVITVWYENARSKIPFFSKATTGVGILIDDIPVQNSIADPLEYVKTAKSGIVLFLIIFVLKILFVIVQNLKSSAIVLVIVSSIYTVPFIILLFMFLSYGSSPKRALITGLVFGILESADYLVGLKINFQAGSMPNGATILIFSMLRLTALYTMFQGLRNLKKL